MTRSQPTSTPGSDKESDTDSHLDQLSATSSGDSTGTSNGSCEEQIETDHGRSRQSPSSKSAQTAPLSTPPFVNLTTQQLQRLTAVLHSMVIINEGSGIDPMLPLLPTFACRPIDFLDVLLRNLKYDQIQVEGVRLYGGAASYVLSEASSFFNDIDLLVYVNFNATAEHLYLDGIKSAVLKSLREIVRDVLTNFCPSQTASLTDGALSRAYIAKLYKHTSRDGAENSNIWSLFSFNNFQGRNIEFKFIHTMERQYQFSIDSWQIDLASMVQEAGGEKPDKVRCYCLFPGLKTALEDLNKKRIRVSKPGEVRGGCFLRFGDLLHKGYHRASLADQELEMLERFLRDFYGANEQIEALDGYLQSHMGACTPYYKVGYLKLLDSLVERLKDSLASRNVRCAASTFTAVIKAKIKEFHRVWRLGAEASLHPHTVARMTGPRKLCSVQAQSNWRQSAPKLLNE